MKKEQLTTMFNIERFNCEHTMTDFDCSYKKMSTTLKGKKLLNRTIDIIDTPVEIAMDRAYKLDPIDTPIEVLEQEKENNLFRPSR